MRILVTGNAGSGKSTLAGLIAARLKLPLYGMDQIVWRQGWQKATKQEEQAWVTAKLPRNYNYSEAYQHYLALPQEGQAEHPSRSGTAKQNLHSHPLK